MLFFDGEDIPDGYELVNDVNIGGGNAKKYTVQVEAAIAKDTDYQLPCSYTVGKDNLEIFVEGVLLSKDHHYIEVGNNEAESNTIQFKWDIEQGYVITIKVY